MKTFITGASGFVGSAVLRQLIKADHTVLALVRSNSDRGCENLFHVAADYRLWVPKPDEMYETNVTGTRNLMLAAAKTGIKRIVYTSSVATLGLNSDGNPGDETTPVSLDDIKPSPTGRVIVDAASGRIPAYVDTGLNLVHVDDVAVGHLLAFERGVSGRRYILGNQNLTLRELLTQVAVAAGQPAPKVRLPHNLVLSIAYFVEAWARLTGSSEPLLTVDGTKLAKKHMFFSCDRAKRELGFHPRPVEEALLDAVDWFQRNGYLSGARKTSGP